MINQELVNFINGQRNKYSDEAIKNALLKKGWREEDIEAAFVISEQPPRQDIQIPDDEQTNTDEAKIQGLATKNNPYVDPEKLMDFGDLLKASISLVLDNFKTIYAITLVPVFVVFAFIAGVVVLFFSTSLSYADSSSAFFLELVSDPTFALPATVFFVLVLFLLILLSIWSQIALIYAIGNINKGIIFREAFGNTKKLVFPFLWVSILSSLVIFGASMLLVIPGLIVGLYIFATRFALVLDEKRGLSALTYSKDLVSGHWWDVLGRFILFYLIYILIFTILGIIPIVNVFASIFLIPFSVAFPVLLYQNLKQVKTFSPSQKKKSKKGGFVFLIVLGIIIIPLIIISIIAGFSILSSKDKVYNSVRISDIKMMATEIELDYLVLDKEVPADIYSIANFKKYKDPATGYEYDYSVTENGKNFQICTDLNDHFEFGNRACIEAGGIITSDDPFSSDFDINDLEINPNNSMFK